MFIIIYRFLIRTSIHSEPIGIEKVIINIKTSTLSPAHPAVDNVVQQSVLASLRLLLLINHLLLVTRLLHPYIHLLLPKYIQQLQLDTKQVTENIIFYQLLQTLCSHGSNEMLYKLSQRVAAGITQAFCTKLFAL